MNFRRTGPLNFKSLIRNYMYATFDTQVLTCSCLHLLMQPMIHVRQITSTCTVGALKEYFYRLKQQVFHNREVITSLHCKEF